MQWEASSASDHFEIQLWGLLEPCRATISRLHLVEMQASKECEKEDIQVCNVDRAWGVLTVYGFLPPRCDGNEDIFQRRDEGEGRRGGCCTRQTIFASGRRFNRTLKSESHQIPYTIPQLPWHIYLLIRTGWSYSLNSCDEFHYAFFRPIFPLRTLFRAHGSHYSHLRRMRTI